MTKVQKLNLKDKVDDGEMDLSLCEIQEVPVREIAVYKKVYSLDLSNNCLTILPKNFATLTNILKLDLSRNKLKELPDNFGELTKLKHLDLYKNDLKHLPLSFGDLKNLKWLDLKDNPLVPAIQSAAGQCLDTKQCQQCASQIVAFYKDLKERVEEDKKKTEIECKKNVEHGHVKVKGNKKGRKKQDEAKPDQETSSVESDSQGLLPQEEDRGPSPEPEQTMTETCTSPHTTLLKVILIFLLIIFTLTAVKYRRTQFIEDTVKSFWHGFFNRTPSFVKSSGEAFGTGFQTIHNTYGIMLMKIIDNNMVNYISTKFKSIYGH